MGKGYSSLSSAARPTVIGLIAACLSIILPLSTVTLPLSTVSFALAESPQRGGTMVVALPSDPPTLNIGFNTSYLARTVATQVFNGLLAFDARLRPQQELAESWEVSSDGTVYTFSLVRNAKWHDGRPLTSADVKFTFEEVLKKLSPEPTFKNVKRVDVIGPYKVRVVLEKPYAPMLLYFASYLAPILPMHIYNGTDIRTNPFNLRPIGSGPFRFQEWMKGSHIVLVRNPQYFRAGLPYLDRLVFRFIPDPSTMLAALQRGEVDYIPRGLPTSLVEAAKRIPNVKVNLTTPAIGGIYRIYFNLRHPILAKREVREAIARAINRDAIVLAATRGLGKVAVGPLNTVAQNFRPFVHPSLPRYTFDPTKANQLLDAAGYARRSDGLRFSLRMLFERRGEDEIAATLVRDQLQSIGVQVILEKMDQATLLNRVFLGWDFDLALMRVISGPDPSYNAKMFTCNQIIKAIFANAMGYCNPDLDRLFDEADSTFDLRKRVALYRTIQEIIVRDLPQVWLYEEILPQPYSTKFRGPNYPQTIFLYELLDRVWRVRD